MNTAISLDTNGGNMFRYKSAFIILLVVFVAFDAKAVVNGVPVADSQYPEAVKILIGDDFDALRNEARVEACSGVMISHSVALTAGHCLLSSPNAKVALYANASEPFSNLIKAEKFYTELLPEDAAQESVAAPTLKPGEFVAGCSPKPKPVGRTKHIDLGLIKFSDPVNDSVQVDFNYSPKVGDSITFVGYGILMNPYLYSIASEVFGPFSINKTSGANTIWRMNDQRMAFKNTDNKVFAADGDSGSPVYYNGALVGILNTVEQNCETVFGEDYGVVNTATILASMEARDFLARGLKYLDQ